MSEPEQKNYVAEAALEYAGRGFPVFPIKAGAKIPLNSNGVNGASTNLEVVKRFWREFPAAWVGIACGGQKRLVAIDIDVDASRNLDGWVSIRALEQIHGELPPTWTVYTPRGGVHKYFLFPADLDFSGVKNSVGKVGQNVDVRVSGGYVVAPPAEGYVLADESGPVTLPVAWARLLLPAPKRAASGSERKPIRGDGYAAAALKDAVGKISGAMEGIRNNTLNSEAFSIAGMVASGLLDEFSAKSALLMAADCCGLPENEAKRTLESGWSKGLLNPRSVPEKKPVAHAARPYIRAVSESEAPGIIEAAEAAAAESIPVWYQALRYKDNILTKDAPNAFLILVNHELWAGALAWCEFSGVAYWRKDAPAVPGINRPLAGEKFSEAHFIYLQTALSFHHSISFPRATIADIVEPVARAAPGNILKEWLESLKWDGLPRVDKWLQTYLGADKSDVNSLFGGWWLIGAVARAMTPGCQVDHTLVLEGDQGAGKSSAVRILAGEWYLGTLGDLRNKDSMSNLRGRWIVELGELDSLRGAEETRIKNFLSQTEDSFRPAYARLDVTRQRACAFIGTTNESRWAHDSTGGRRFWPVKIVKLNRDALTRDREQLWAEAVQHFKFGEPWYPHNQLTGAELVQSAILDAQEARFSVDAWEPIICAWALQRSEFSIGDVLLECLKIPAERWGRSEQTRVGNILRRLSYNIVGRDNNGKGARLYGR